VLTLINTTIYFAGASTTMKKGFLDWHQVAEGQYKWDENISLEYMSGFMTGKFFTSYTPI
jgi:hypothetical protein